MGKKSAVEGAPLPPRARNYQDETSESGEAILVSTLNPSLVPPLGPTASVLVAPTADAAKPTPPPALSNEMNEIISEMWRSQFRLHNFKNIKNSLEDEVTGFEFQLGVILASKSAESASPTATSSKTVALRLADRAQKRKLEEEDEETRIRRQLQQAIAQQESNDVEYSDEIIRLHDCFAKLYNTQMAEVDTRVQSGIASISQPPQPPASLAFDWEAAFDANSKALKLVESVSTANTLRVLRMEHNWAFFKPLGGFATEDWEAGGSFKQQMSAQHGETLKAVDSKLGSNRQETLDDFTEMKGQIEAMRAEFNSDKVEMLEAFQTEIEALHRANAELANDLSQMRAEVAAINERKNGRFRVDLKRAFRRCDRDGPHVVPTAKSEPSDS